MNHQSSFGDELVENVIILSINKNSFLNIKIDLDLTIVL